MNKVSFEKENNCKTTPLLLKKVVRMLQVVVNLAQLVAEKTHPLCFAGSEERYWVEGVRNSWFTTEGAEWIHGGRREWWKA